MEHHSSIKAILLFWLAAMLMVLLLPVTKAQEANEFYLAPDLDGDGLPNEIEVNGWWNGAGGPFYTDPLDPDGDDDNLTDGEEKLFDSKPNNSASPGIYIIYDNAFKTKEYYPWQQYGHLLLARGDAIGSSFNPPNPDDIDVQKNLGVDLDAVVVRRGSAFTIGGPLDGSLQIVKSISSLTDLSAIQDPYTGLWQVIVPLDGTVGEYTLKMGAKSLDLFVIFELPTPAGELTPLGLEKFVYDDDPFKTYDEKSVLLGDRRYPSATGTPYDSQLSHSNFVAEGNPYTYSNHQYNRYLLEEYVIETINGLTSQQAAADALTEKVDALTVFRNPRAFVDSWKVLHPGSNPRQQCSNISGLLTSFLRSAGIPARPVMTDWRDSSFDHATEVWLNNQWRVYRGYNKFEMKTSPDNTHTGCADSIWPKCGSDKDYSRYDWGRLRYKPWHSGGDGNGNMIVLGDDTWTSTGLTYRWASWAVNKINLNESRLKTQNTSYWAYWGWTQEPVNLGAPGWPPAPPSGAQVTSRTLQSDNSTYYLPIIMNDKNEGPLPSIELRQIVAEYGVDTNGNGRYDQLVLDVEVIASQPGNYWLWGQLVASRPEPSLNFAGGVVSEALAPLTLVAGRQVIQLSFDGPDIALSGVDGPYILQTLRLTDVAEPGPTDFMNQNLANRQNTYTTSPYQAENFENYGATLSDRYSHAVLDSNGDGQPDTLVVTTALNVSQPGIYTVEGSLYDSQGQFISHAAWSGSGSDVTLSFEQAAGGVGPYTLQELNLLNVQGQSIDDTPGVAYTIEAITALAAAVSASFDVAPADLTATGSIITPTNTFAETRVNGNLQVDAEVQVAVAGSYKLEAWLADAAGNLLTWAAGPATSLSTGRQTLSLTFNGRTIRDRGVDGPYKVVALKILDATTNYQVLDKVNVALTTRVYSRDQFDGTSVVFEDFVENGSGQWLGEPGWEISSNKFFSPSHAWYGANADTSLILAAPLNFSAVTHPGLKFQTSYRLADNDDRGYLEISIDGVSWDTVATFAGDSSWSTRVVNLDQLTGQSLVLVRFRLASAAGAPDDYWAIDDILIGEMTSPPATPTPTPTDTATPTPTPTDTPTPTNTPSDPPTPTPTPNTSADLQGYWSLNETSGQRLDSSGQGNHLTDNNTVASATGRMGRAADFEKNNKEYLSIDDAAQNGLDLSGSFTLVGWFRAETLNSNSQVLISKYELGSNDRAYRVDWRGSNKLGFVVSPDGTLTNDYLLEATPTFTLTTNTWYHLAAVFDASQKTLTLYLNGNQLASRSVNYSNVFNTSAAFMLGANVQNGVPYQHFDGLLDEWRVFSRALSGSEIQGLMNSP